MNLRSVDLNLLVALDALLSELHVTRAAERVGLSQPAMSNALSRLRHIFQDELLVRTAAGMQATPRALELAEPVARILRQIERVIESDAGFEPSQAKRSFTIRLSDLLSLLLLPDLLSRFGEIAPQVALDVVHLPPSRTVEALERDEIDVAVSMGLEHSTSIRSEVALSDRMVCVMRTGHPLADGPVSIGDFLKHRHLKVSISPTDLRFVDNVLAGDQLVRDVAVNVPHWLTVPHILAKTDMIAVMPGRLATAIEAGGFIARDLPFASAPFHWSIYWHRRHDANPAIRWLRETVAGTFKDVG